MALVVAPNDDGSVRRQGAMPQRLPGGNRQKLTSSRGACAKSVGNSHTEPKSRVVDGERREKNGEYVDVGSQQRPGNQKAGALWESIVRA